METLSKYVQGSNADHDHCYAVPLPETSKESVNDLEEKVKDLQRELESLRLRKQPFTIRNIIQDPDKMLYIYIIFHGGIQCVGQCFGEDGSI